MDSAEGNGRKATAKQREVPLAQKSWQRDAGQYPLTVDRENKRGGDHYENTGKMQTDLGRADRLGDGHADIRC